MKIILKEEQVIQLKEYYQREISYLKDILTMSDEQKKNSLPEMFYYFFDDFLVEEDVEFTPPTEKRPSNTMDEPDEDVEMFDNDYELVEWLSRNNPKLYNHFAEYLYRKVVYFELPIYDTEYPSWAYFDDSVSIIKNQWLIHFTDNAYSIAKDGFKYGVDDPEKLSLTKHMSDFDKKNGGYNFAYRLEDFHHYGYKGYGNYKYGKEAVIFRASGVLTYHNGDEEPQVIFYGNTATDIIPIYREDDEFYIEGKNGRRLYSKEDLRLVVNWLTKNYVQYRKQLI